MTYYEFMEKWKKARPEYQTEHKNFCNDGIVKEGIWAEPSNSKIMFLLKETYSHFCDDIRGNGHCGSGTSPTFWRRMKMWTYIIDKVLKRNIPSFEEVKEQKEQANDSIAYVNLKKCGEKKELNKEAYSNDNNICVYVKRDKDFLLEQINFIKPQIILCSGTFKFCNILFPDIEANKIADKLYKIRDMYLIDFYHLSRRGAYKKNYDELLKIIHPLLGKAL